MADETTGSTPGARPKRGAPYGNKNARSTPWALARRGILSPAAARDARGFHSDLVAQLGGEGHVTAVARARIEAAALARAAALEVMAEYRKTGSLSTADEVSTTTPDGRTVTRRRAALGPLLLSCVNAWSRALGDLPLERVARPVEADPWAWAKSAVLDVPAIVQDASQSEQAPASEAQAPAGGTDIVTARLTPPGGVYGPGDLA